MGSLAILKLDKLIFDEEKFGSAPLLYRDYSALFQKSDVVMTVFENDDGERFDWPVVKKRLREVVDRIELLGFTLPWIQRRLESLIAECFEEVEMSETVAPESAVSAASVAAALSDIDASEDRPDSKRGLQYYLWNVQRDRLNRAFNLDGNSDFFEPLCGQLEVCATIRLLAELPRNADLALVWDIGEGNDDYYETGALPMALDPTQQFLIVTEGRSDIKILQRALELRRPHIQDFFSFTDMAEGYPFGGTGNLLNFTKGLGAIKVQNRSLIIFDNDAEGISKFDEAEKLKLPRNIRVMHLPKLQKDQHIKAIGPNGTAVADINGTAASIELYLDLTSVNREPQIRWKNYVERIDKYQGEIEKKNDYTEAFLGWTPVSGKYNFEKLDLCIDEIVRVAADMAEALLKPDPSHDFDWKYN